MPPLSRRLPVTCRNAGIDLVSGDPSLLKHCQDPCQWFTVIVSHMADNENSKLADHAETRGGRMPA